MTCKCDLCGKFTKQENLMGMGGEYDEYWFECINCMSPSDLEHFKRIKEQQKQYDESLKHDST